MKRFTLFVMMVMCGLFAIAQNGMIDLRSESKAEITQSSFQTLRATFSYGALESAEFSTERGVFSSIMLEGTFPSGEIGTPELPATHELLAVPFGATPSVSVISYTTKDYNLSEYGINTIIPRQPSVRKDQKPEDVKFIYNEEAYQTRGLATAPEATIEVQGTMRGIRIGSLVINPVSYNAKDNTIRVFNDIEVEINFEGANIAETERMLVNTYSPYFDIVYKQMFNYRQIMDVYDDHPDLMAYPVHMIVITPQNFVSALEPWTNWKIQKGFDVQIHTTAETGSTYNAIRSYVQNLYNTGVSQGNTPTFLILVGDTGQIPATTGSSSQKVTDLYYGSVDNDYFPDMFYSRMSAENTGQLTNIINKVLQYEQYTMPDPSYLSKVTLIAGWDNSWTSYVGAPTINYATTYYYNTEHGFTQVNSHVNQSQYSGCYNSLSTGVGFVNYTAHGDNQEWTQPNLTNSGVNQLSNADKYFLAMGNCCLSGNFGYSQPCFGEAMIRAQNKGAYSYIGSCPYTYWYEDYYFGVGATNTFGNTPNINNTATGVYDGVWMDDTYNTVSSMVFLGNLAVCYGATGGYQTSVTPLYYWQSYHVLGDGSIMPYRVNPTANTVSHDATFPAGETSFTVNAEEGSYVGISQDNVLLGAALVEASGSVDVTVTPVTSGQVRIVVTKPQRQPYIQDIDVSGSTPTTYTITASVNPTDAGTVTGANTYNAGEQCSLTASPNAGYNFVDWTKDGEQVSTDETYTFTVTADEEYVANFELQTFDITAITDPEDGGVITITGDFTYGSEVTISVEPAENFVFQYWSENGDIISYETTYSLFAYEDRHLVAVLIDVTGVDENAQQAVSIYPNPVNDKLIIEAEETIGMVEIYNLTGAMVLNQECNSAKAELEVNELQSGIYFIKMTNNCNVVTRSFVKK
jgi:Peptidase family C25, C terminal ig-like domain./Peptidase family C25./Propeptide_C25.